MEYAVLNYYNNTAIFVGVVDIYGPHFFIYGPPVSFPRRVKSHKYR